MNIDESLAREYLELKEFDLIKFEPDGNCPPDFSVSDKIGIEVRRLNKNHYQNGNRVAFEQESTPIVDGITSTLKSYGKVKEIGCQFAIVSLKRPFPSLKAIKKTIRDKIDIFLKSKCSGIYEFSIESSITIKLTPANDDHEFTFEVGAITDFDISGWVVPEVTENIRICVGEKTEKIRPYVENYEKWWLLLVDHVGYGRNGEQIKSSVVKPAQWDRIIVLDPVSKSAYEI